MERDQLLSEEGNRIFYLIRGVNLPERRDTVERHYETYQSTDRSRLRLPESFLVSCLVLHTISRLCHLARSPLFVALSSLHLRTEVLFSSIGERMLMWCER